MRVTRDDEWVLFAIALAVVMAGCLMAIGSEQPRFVVENKCQPLNFTVTNKIVTVKPVSPAPRSAVGHTHTCAAGHTWDHTMDGGTHRCPFCGLPQTVVDPPGRPLTLTGTSGPTLIQFAPIQGGCAGGNCPAPTYQPLLPWRR